MTLSIYRNGTVGATNGTLEIPGDGVGISIGQIGSTATLYLRCSAGRRNAEAFQAPAPTDCHVSKDGVNYASSVTYNIGDVQDTNVPLFLKRVAETTGGALPPVPLIPRVGMIQTEAY